MYQGVYGEEELVSDDETDKRQRDYNRVTSRRIFGGE